MQAGPSGAANGATRCRPRPHLHALVPGGQAPVVDKECVRQLLVACKQPGQGKTEGIKACSAESACMRKGREPCLGNASVQGGQGRARRQVGHAPPSRSNARTVQTTASLPAPSGCHRRPNPNPPPPLTVHIHQQVHPHLVHLVAHVEHLGAALRGWVGPLRPERVGGGLGREGVWHQGGRDSVGQLASCECG